MTKTMRRQRTRSGLKRRVRKNKTMRGGGMLERLNVYKIETFKQTGYKFAEKSLLRYLNTYDGILNKAPTIKDIYSNFYKKGMTIDAYDPIEIKTSFFLGKVQNVTNSLINDGAKKGSGVRPMLSPDDFNDVLDKINSGWVNKQKFTTENMCRKFIDFGLSFEKFWNEYYFPNIIKKNNPDATNSVSVTNDVSKTVGNAVGSTSKAVSDVVKRLGRFGSFVGK